MHKKQAKQYAVVTLNQILRRFPGFICTFAPVRYLFFDI